MKMIKKMFMFCAALFLGLVILPISSAEAATINVPADCATIQAAINIAEDGDIVEVTQPQDRYLENINFLGKAITLKSIDPLNPAVVAATIIDGGGNGSVVTFHNGEGKNAVIEGFTITNGLAASGGGIYCDNSSPTIRNCNIIENTANEQTTFEKGGGGIYCRNYSAPTIEYCTISNNKAEIGYRSSGGGGIFCVRSSPTIRYCTISGNDTTGATTGGGGGIYLMFDPSATITDCQITGNSVSGNHFSGGGGICVNNSSPTINRCDITDNKSLGTHIVCAGGIYIEGNSPVISHCTISGNIVDPDEDGSGLGGGILSTGASPTIIDCDIINNSVSLFDGYGGGGLCCYADSARVVNCKISGNSAAVSGIGGGGGIFCWANSTATFENCIITGNSVDLDEDGFEGGGGGMYCDFNTSPTINNCTIANNNFIFPGDPYYVGGGGLYCNYNAAPIITNSILWGNTASIGNNEIYYNNTQPVITYSDIQGGWGTLQDMEDNHNISDDPLFVVDDFHLTEGSPCIDAGNIYAPNLPETDIDGDDRIMDGDCDGEVIVDMGADEFSPCSVNGQISPSIESLWPPNHTMVPITLNVSEFPTDAIISITSVEVSEFSGQESDDVFGDNIYDENNFEPDWEITGDLTVNLRSERSRASMGRTYTITVTATWDSDCSCSSVFTTDVVVPHDKRQ